MFMRTNWLLRRFAKCSREVKVVLFKSYCRPICLYDACWWSNYNSACLTKLKLCYHKIVFAFKRCDSVTQILFDLCLSCCVLILLPKLLADDFILILLFYRLTSLKVMSRINLSIRENWTLIVLPFRKNVNTVKKIQTYKGIGLPNEWMKKILCRNHAQKLSSTLSI